MQKASLLLLTHLAQGSTKGLISLLNMVLPAGFIVQGSVWKGQFQTTELSLETA